MYIGKKVSFPLLWFFAKQNIYFTFGLSAVVVTLYHFLDCKFLGIPFLPVTTIGTAVAFYVGFKIMRHMRDFGKQENYGVDLLIQVEH